MCELAPFGDVLWARKITELWLSAQETGPVFARIRQGRGDMRNAQATDLPMTTRSIQRLLGRFPVWTDVQRRTVTPHDLRRSFARSLFLTGIPVEAIRQNMGHAGVKTTQDYIGALDRLNRAPLRVYDPSEVLARMKAATP